VTAGGNATQPETGSPLFVLRPDDSGRGANIFTVNNLDVNDGMFYRISVIASNQPINASQVRPLP